jgi:hypothetical protein
MFGQLLLGQWLGKARTFLELEIVIGDFLLIMEETMALALTPVSATE